MNRIIIDIYGADAGHEVICRGAELALNQFPDMNLTLVGAEGDILPFISPEYISGGRVKIINSTVSVSNTDTADCILRGKSNSSMAIALDELKNDDSAVGLLSAGATGALFVGSIFRLGLMGKLKTPVLASSIVKADGGRVCLLDCGANINPTPKDMVRFALLGNVFAKTLYGLAAPRVSLASVGREDKKGNELTLKTFGLLKEQPINFIGNSEGNDLLTGYSDVVVADGFSGNLLLKCSEASGKIAISKVRAMAEKYPDQKHIFDDMIEDLNSVFELNSRGGATFLGTVKPVIKMHGSAVAETVPACIGQLLLLKENAFTENTANALDNLN